MSARAVVLKLHLQKHYLLKNYTSKDLDIYLDPKESYVELRPKADADCLRMLRHADAQVASKYRSFLTFIRCELVLVLNPAVSFDRARALAQKNMLSIDALKRPTTAPASAQPRYCVTGTLARTKSFVSELYRVHGHEHAEDGAVSPLSSSSEHVAAPSPPVKKSPIESTGSNVNNGAITPAASSSASSTPLLECVVALLVRAGGDQLIGALCNDVFKSLRGTLTELAGVERAKDFFGAHADVFEVYGPLTQKRVRFVPGCDTSQAAAAGEIALNASENGDSRKGNNGSKPNSVALSENVWGQFAKRLTATSTNADESDDRNPSLSLSTSELDAIANNAGGSSGGGGTAGFGVRQASPGAGRGAPLRSSMPALGRSPPTLGGVDVLAATFGEAGGESGAELARAVAAAHAACGGGTPTVASSEGGAGRVSFVSDAAAGEVRRALSGVPIAVRAWRTRASNTCQGAALCVASGDVFVFETVGGGGALLRELLGDASVPKLFLDVSRDAPTLLALGVRLAMALDVRTAHQIMNELRERAGVGSGRHVWPGLALLLDQYVSAGSGGRFANAAQRAAQSVGAPGTSPSSSSPSGAGLLGNGSGEDDNAPWRTALPMAAPALQALAAEIDCLFALYAALHDECARLLPRLLRAASDAVVQRVSLPQQPLYAPPRDAQLAPLVDLLLPTGALSSGAVPVNGDGNNSSVSSGAIGAIGSNNNNNNNNSNNSNNNNNNNSVAGVFGNALASQQWGVPGLPWGVPGQQ
mmetsp:Transcript_19820/g.34011  ORF Transcript_19820/g.34011 Transcript_19820/m.34011 type:complete len:759 (-) Transcript_19820:41-2317(-)